MPRNSLGRLAKHSLRPRASRKVFLHEAQHVSTHDIGNVLSVVFSLQHVCGEQPDRCNIKWNLRCSIVVAAQRNMLHADEVSNVLCVSSQQIATYQAFTSLTAQLS